ncbi:YoaK family protein [Streptomyces sp. NPDC005318]|uniref:YoaK family protein n=1 Tax=Streptomyces sp. NPDC005318 TaxID=3157031 RepID=UPI0033B6A947
MPVVLREAWATLVPDMTDRHGPLPPMMLALTVVTGLVDAVSFLQLGRVFVANMTGNVVFSGFAVAGAPGFSVTASLVALVSFIAGAVLSGLLVHRHAHRGKMLQYALLAETLCFAAAVIVTQMSGSPYVGEVRFTLIVLLALGLGVQNAAARALAVPDLMTTVLTLTITGIAADSRLVGGTGSKAGRRVLSACAMLLGAVAGTFAFLHGHPALPLLFALIILAGVTAAATVLARADAPWVRPLAKN